MNKNLSAVKFPEKERDENIINNMFFDITGNMTVWKVHETYIGTGNYPQWERNEPLINTDITTDERDITTDEN